MNIDIYTDNPKKKERDEIKFLCQELPEIKEIESKSLEESNRGIFLLTFYKVDNSIIKRYYFNGKEVIREFDSITGARVTNGIQKGMGSHCFLNAGDKWKNATYSMYMYLPCQIKFMIRDFKFNNQYINERALDYVETYEDVTTEYIQSIDNIEFLSKINATGIIKYLIESRNPREFEKKDAKLFLNEKFNENDITAYLEIENYKKENMINKKINIELVKKIASLSSIPSQIISLYEITLNKLTISQFLNYKQLKAHNVIYYLDYINMLETLEKNVNSKILMPKQIKSKHDKLQKELNEIRAIEEERKLTKKNKKYEVKVNEHQSKLIDVLNNIQDERYAIVIPNTYEEFAKEGIELNHCVKSYFHKVASGKSNIIFIRDKNDIEHSKYTMEIANDKIVQFRGLNNSAPAKSTNKIKEQIQQCISN